MPNWVYNTLTIEGSPESVKRFKEQIGKPFTLAQETYGMGDISSSGFPTKIKQVTYDNPVFAFHNIYSYKDAGITDEEYACQPSRSDLDVSDPNWWADNQAKAKVDKSWYSFNNREWGCKWDVAVSNDNEYPDTQLYSDEPNGENHVLVYGFDTPWGTPDEALLELSRQYPTLLFTLEYEEETGWGGEMEILRGEVISESEYGWKCRECDHTEEDTPYCETCEFDICPKCGYGEPMDEDRANCEEHREEVNA